MGEKEFIEREKAKQYLVDEYAYAAAEVFDKIPAADAVEVVRCKDCRYGEPYLHYFYCENDNAPWAENTMANLVDANDFCSYGERRAEE